MKSCLGAESENKGLVIILSRHLIVKTQKWKSQNNVWNLFKFNNEDTRTTSLTSLIMNRYYILVWHSTVDFEQVNTSLVVINTSLYS